MSTGNDWEKNRNLAHAIAAKYDVPGCDADDLRQEALIVLWQAARSHNEELGPFKPWARRLIEAKMIDLLRKATLTGRHRKGKRPREVTLVEGHEPSVEPGRQLQEIVDLLPTLTESERSAIASKLNGTYRASDRREENALQRAKRKLAA